MHSLLRAILAVLVFALPAQLLASGEATVSGTITDSLGAVIQNAQVELIDAEQISSEAAGAVSGHVLQTASTDAHGHYAFSVAAPARCFIRVHAASFQSAASDQKFVAPAHPAQLDLTLSPSVVAQQIVVTATGVPTPEVQTGASISVLDQSSLDTRLGVEEELRLQPGAQLTSNGQAGGVTSLFVRGGPSDATKVMIDGVPVNDIGGAFNFADLSAAGFEKAELYRGPDSALYGTDAEAGVLVLTTRRGLTPLPELTYAVDGGNLHTLHEEGTLGGAYRRFDYFTDLSRFGTQNSTPSSEFHNATGLANIGVQLLPSTELRATVRRSVSAFDVANNFDLYQIPDDGVGREQDTSFGVTLENHATAHWHNLIRYAGLRLRQENDELGHTGICYDPNNPPTFACTPASMYQEYLGKVVTIRGANGYQVTGQAILQYGPGPTYSSEFADRDSIYAQSDYRWNSHLAALFGFRYEAEAGYSYSNDPEYAYVLKNNKSRGNYSYMMQLNGGFWNRLYYNAASGLENNDVFGFAATPRASLVYHVLKPRAEGIFSGTRLSFNFGKGVKEPSIYDETNSVYDLLQEQPGGSALITQYGVKPFRAEQSRTYDGGVQQMFWNGRARLSITYFHNEFGDQAEFVPYMALTEFGVSPGAATFLETVNPYGGAFLNTLDYRAQGAEVEAEVHITLHLSARGGWTYTDAVVQRSYNGMPSQADFNPLFPVPIGGYYPLIGARPFRIAPNTGFFAVDWSSPRFTVRMTGTMVSRRDDSDFLVGQDVAGDNSLLLPNRNLDPAYQKLDLYGSVRICKHLSAYTSMQNLLNQRYYEAFGYPALPFTIRAGMQFTFGGQSWKL